MSTPILTVIKQICSEKNISMDAVVETIESALAAAYRKDFGSKLQNIKVNFNVETGQFKVFDVKTVVEDMEIDEEEMEELIKDKKDKKKDEAPKEAKASKKEKKEDKKDDKKKDSQEPKVAEASKEAEVVEESEEEKKKFNPKTEIMISDALDLKKDAEIGDEIKTDLEVPEAFGRMAAQTAKQVIIQKLREAERTALFDDYKDKEGEVLSGVVQRREGRNILIDLGRLSVLLPPEEQIEGEKYNIGSRIKVYVLLVNSTTKGPEVIVSRTHPEILRRLFTLEIPEISNGSVEIKAIAREAGSRSKVAVEAVQENIDPIGSCVGQRGARIQTIISELGGEKVDIIEYSDDPAQFIINSLSPAKVLDISTKEEEKSAVATVKEDQLSLAIGKAGQNVRLAAKLTGWKINISVEGKGEVGVEDDNVEGKDADNAPDEEVKPARNAQPAELHSKAMLAGSPSDAGGEEPKEEMKEETKEVKTKEENKKKESDNKEKENKE